MNVQAVKLGRIPNLAGSPPPWQNPAMSTLATTDPKELRPLLHAEVDKLRDEDLLAARRALLEIEARRLADELGAALDEDWASGRITNESVAEAILEHRRKHPYR